MTAAVGYLGAGLFFLSASMFLGLLPGYETAWSVCFALGGIFAIIGVGAHLLSAPPKLPPE